MRRFSWKRRTLGSEENRLTNPRPVRFYLDHAHSRMMTANEAVARSGHEHPLVLPQVLHLRQVPLRTRVKLPQLSHASPS